ncbi:microcin ABC transporter ATP-binding protein [Achromobacter marplatensis]|uniref:Peptide/nickel transport system ATP-binding protein n=1 Tax=Achromobacter marplatensis TaxID=470868 RepID=A0ABX9GAK6_9BURK|nr:ABC transporter ATP-binding protein [Achromobacter marplatensis]OWT67839.1 microcin ABC transporter ATP-binding protein [Achromobacter marplatensis]RBP19681.1 peptide/nickel transport system ATP-binding protein [Achromobacter marplatensis]CAB3637802.1 Glutathione import ATP-binding protein GsiA [Achromobacter marplatensis]
MKTTSANRETGQAPALKISALTVQAGHGAARRPVIENISFEVYPGETLCVVGESGSGKSVTSLAAMGLLPKGVLTATAGSILLGNDDVLQATPDRLRALRASRIAMVFQEPMTALNPVQKVGRQIDEVLRLHSRLGASERRKQVLAMLESVHLPDIERVYNAYPHQLSGGQRQRIVIAMALILKPQVLIADEPTTALDVTTQEQILTLIRELQERQRTAVVFITHDFGVVAEIADRIVVMNRGSVVETGTRDQILARPSQAYTRMLVSSVPSLVPQQRSLPSGEKVLEIIGLGKTYKEKPFFGAARVVAAAKDVALTVRRGEIAGVVGESGSGKSTVARCVVRLIEPSAGAIFLKDEDIVQVSSAQMRLRRTRVQMIFQDPYRSLNPRRQVGDSLIEGLVNFGVANAEAREKAAQALELVGLGRDVMQRYPHQFSGGQRQRVCIARAVVMEPDLLVADEAVSALDVSVQDQVLKLLEEIRVRTGVAILFITHDLRVAAQICDSIVVMQKGCVVESGPAARVLTAPQQAYTRELIEAAPGRDWDFRNFRALRAA